jgi:2-isopropylmalate synthase
MAVVKVKVGDDNMISAAEGNGPVNAFDQALRKALLPLFPAVKDISLADYKVRILNSNLGTAAITRVLVDWHDGVRRWSTVGAGSNILDATWLALADGYEYSLTKVERADPSALPATQPAAQTR